MDNPTKHICGVCNDEWLTEEEYNNHVCPQTNFQPTDAQHLVRSTTPDFVAVQEASLTRGLETAQTNNDEVQAARNQEAIEQLNAPQTPENPTVNLG